MSEETRKRHFNDPDAARTDLGYEGGSRCRSRGRGWWWAGVVTGGPRRGGIAVPGKLADHRDGDVRRGTDGRRYRRSYWALIGGLIGYPASRKSGPACMTAGFCDGGIVMGALHDRLEDAAVFRARVDRLLAGSRFMPAAPRARRRLTRRAERRVR